MLFLWEGSMPNSDWSQWVGRTEVAADEANARPIEALAATLDMPARVQPGDPLPTLAYWLYFLPLAPMSQIASNGHEKLGEFLPPLPLERRMWAGGRFRFHDAPRVGDALEKRSEIIKIEEKETKSGPMALVTVKHEIHSPRGLAVMEEQDIAYLETPKVYAPPKPVPLRGDLSWQEPFPIDPVLLFRFSALTFNGHRIHYDLAYTTEVEHYPGLLVHGPLQAMLLIRAAEQRNPGRNAARYSFRGVRPLFHFDALFLSGREREGGIDLFTSNGEGLVCMQAALDWRE
jgi:3-methylfumaryl-CoA hydratase